MVKSKIAVVAVLCLGLSACANDGSDRGKEIAGTAVGAALGGLLGAQIGSGTGQLIATAAGVALGGYLGNQVGKSLDQADRVAAEKNAQQSLEYAKTGTTSGWTNPDTGHSGTFTPGQPQQTAGTWCRPFEQTITVDGRTETATGTACRQQDGTWRIQQ